MNLMKYESEDKSIQTCLLTLKLLHRDILQVTEVPVNSNLKTVLKQVQKQIGKKKAFWYEQLQAMRFGRLRFKMCCYSMDPETNQKRVTQRCSIGEMMQVQHAVIPSVDMLTVHNWSDPDNELQKFLFSKDIRAIVWSFMICIKTYTEQMNCPIVGNGYDDTSKYFITVDACPLLEVRTQPLLLEAPLLPCHEVSFVRLKKTHGIIHNTIFTSSSPSGQIGDDEYETVSLMHGIETCVTIFRIPDIPFLSFENDQFTFGDILIHNAFVSGLTKALINALLPNDTFVKKRTRSQHFGHPLRPKFNDFYHILLTDILLVVFQNRCGELPSYVFTEDRSKFIRKIKKKLCVQETILCKCVLNIRFGKPSYYGDHSCCWDTFRQAYTSRKLTNEQLQPPWVDCVPRWYKLWFRKQCLRQIR